MITEKKKLPPMLARLKKKGKLKLKKEDIEKYATEREKRYLREYKNETTKPGICPVCGSRDIEYDPNDTEFVEFDLGGNTPFFSRYGVCDEGHQLKTVYKLIFRSTSRSGPAVAPKGPETKMLDME